MSVATWDQVSGTVTPSASNTVVPSVLRISERRSTKRMPSYGLFRPRVKRRETRIDHLEKGPRRKPGAEKGVGEGRPVAPPNTRSVELEHGQGHDGRDLHPARRGGSPEQRSTTIPSVRTEARPPYVVVSPQIRGQRLSTDCGLRGPRFHQASH